MIEKIKQKPLHATGAVLLAAAFGFALADMILYSAVSLCASGALTLYVVYKEKDISVSKWIRGLTERRVDKAILIGLAVACYVLRQDEPYICLWFVLGLLNAHLFDRN